MKITYSILGVTAGAALLLAVGCSKEEPPAGDTPKTMSPAASETPQPADALKAVAEQAQPAAAAAAQQAVDTAASQANAAVAAASPEAQGLIDKAKDLVTNEKYQDALKLVQQLSSLKLTDEQQKLVDGLKAQIQTALTKATGTDAASALGNVLGGKK